MVKKNIRKLPFVTKNTKYKNFNSTVNKFYLILYLQDSKVKLLTTFNTCGYTDDGLYSISCNQSKVFLAIRTKFN